MTAGPLRRIAAAIGLVALVPVASMLIQGTLTPEEAALRAIVVGLVVVVLANLARRVVASMLQRVERRTPDADDRASSDPRRMSDRRAGGAAGPAA